MGLFKKKERQPNANFDKKVQWLKNSGHSIKGLFLEWLAEQELFAIVGGEIKRINKAKQKIKRNPQQKLTLKKKVSKMSKKVIDDWVRANFDGQSSEELKKEFLGEINTITSGIKSGNFYKKQDLFGMDDIDDFLAELDDEWDEDESDDYLEDTSGESFSAWSEFGGGKSIDKLENNVNKKSIQIDEEKYNIETESNGDIFVEYNGTDYSGLITPLKKGELSDIIITLIKSDNKIRKYIKDVILTSHKFKLQFEREWDSIQKYVLDELDESKNIGEAEDIDYNFDREKYKKKLLDNHLKTFIYYYTEGSDKINLNIGYFFEYVYQGYNVDDIKLSDIGIILKDKSLKKKGESMQTIKKEHLDKLKLSALAESSELAGPVPALSNKIIQLKQKVVDLVNFGESLDSSDIRGIYRFKTMKKDCLNDCKTLTATLNHSNPVLKNKYQGTLSDAIITVITADNELDSKNIDELGAEKIINDTKEEINEIKKIDNELGEKVSSTYDDVADEIREKEDDLVFNPAKVKLDNGALPVAEEDEDNEIDDELEAAGESYSAFGEADEKKSGSSLGDIVKVAGAVGSVTALVTAAIAVPINLMRSKKNINVEKEFGSALHIKQPLIATDDVSKDTVASYSKFVETSTAIAIKQALESSVAKSDGGNIVARSKDVLNNKMTAINTKDRKGKNIASKDTEARILSSFSQSYNPYLEEVYKKFYSRNAESASLVFNIKNMVSAGEAGEFVNDNKHAPVSTIKVEIQYKDNTNMMLLDNKIQTKSSSLSVDVNGRRLPYDDVIKTFVEMNTKYFNNIKVTANERDTDKVLKNSVKMIKSAGSDKEKALLKSNAFADIVNKIENIKTPLFHLLISNEAYHEIKKHGIDLRNKSTYEKIMDRLPLISIAIADEESEIITYSEGQYMNYRSVNYKDLESEISKYEKELQSMIKYGMR